MVKVEQTRLCCFATGILGGKEIFKVSDRRLGRNKSYH